MTMIDPFANPASGFDRIQDHVNHALIITPKNYLTGLTTKHSKAPGDAEAVEADVVVLHADGTVEEIPMLRIYQGGLRGQLRRSMGQMVIGRLGKTPTPKGDAWVLNEASAEDRALGVAYLEAKAQGKLKTPAPAAAGTAPVGAPSTDPFA